MLVEIGRSAVYKRFFRSLLKQGTYYQRSNFSRYPQYYLLLERHSKLQFCGNILRTTVLDSYCVRECASSTEKTEGTIDKLTFETVCKETLHSLTDYFEELIESVPQLKYADVNYNDGVLTVHLGSNYGTYVINRQSPNLQIWLSSPTSGPKRYDFVDGTWVYKHDKTTLHSLLDSEIKEIVNQQVHFVEKCLYAKPKV